MSSCCFFGHHDCPDFVATKLKEQIITLIINHSVNIFYVGNHGNFDRIVLNTLKELKNNYNIKFYIVLAYMPAKTSSEKNTLLPDGIELVPKRFAISFRNKWMISKSNYLISYVEHDFGNASKFVNAAKKAGVICFNITL